MIENVLYTNLCLAERICFKKSDVLRWKSEPMKPFTLALIQARAGWDVDENMRRAIQAIYNAAQQGAAVICLQELFRTPYLCQTEDPSLFDYAEPIEGPTFEALGPVAKEAGVTLIAPIFERRAPGVYHNSILVIAADGTRAGLYRKMHIPDDPGYYEKYYFTPGDLGFRAFDTPVGKVGALICWDQWYPEGARLTAMQGAQVLVYPTAIGWHPREKAQVGQPQREAWQIMQRAHAISNGVFVAAVNRVGHEVCARGGEGIEFWGSSFICDPFGQIIAEGSSSEEAIVTAEIDPKRIEEVRRNWPFLRDRRIDAYEGIQARFLDGGGLS